jgi:hypothetical protein
MDSNLHLLLSFISLSAFFIYYSLEEELNKCQSNPTLLNSTKRLETE